MRNISFVQPKGQGGSVPIIVLKDATGRYYYEDLGTSEPIDIVLDEATALIRVSAIGGGIFMRAQANASGGEAVPATATLTLTGAITGAVHAESVVTTDETAPADDSTITIGDRTYTFKTTLTGAEDEVLIGASSATALDNLKSAINASAGVGTTYGTGTVAHADVVATDNADTTQKIVARVPGTSANALATTASTDPDSHLDWEDTTLGGGTGSSVAGVNGETVDINGTEYTFVTVLSEDYAEAIANEVLHAGTDAVALDNLKVAVNGGATEGTNYSTGTTQPEDIEATTNTDTTQVFQAQTLGEAGNEYTVSDTLANGSFGGETTFTGGSETANFDAYIPQGETMDFGIDDDVTTISFVAVGSNTDIAVIEY